MSPGFRIPKFGSIDSPVNLSRTAVSLALLAGIYVVYYAFTHYGMIGGAAIGILPMVVCVLWVTVRNPAISMLGLFVVNYFVVGLMRYVTNVPIGMFVDALIGYNLLILVLHAAVRRVEWRNALTGLTLISAIWMIYCIFELLNPLAVSVSGWFTAARSLAFYFFFLVVLTQIILAEHKYLRYMLAIWSALTLIAVAKACIQKFVGFNAAEMHWLYVEGGATTHIIYTGIRYFSFFSDAANFGAAMGMSMVVFGIAGFYYRHPFMKFYMFVVAAAACYGMLISGTRSALAVPFAGFAVFVLLSCNARLILIGLVGLIGAFIFLNFTNIGQGNAIIRRARSAFNTEDASFQTRLSNQTKLRELLTDKPFGVGVGHGGVKALKFAPNSPFSQIPTDSWFVMIWVETGIVGLLLHIFTLLYILGHGAWLIIFKLKNHQVRGFTAALVCGISGVCVMAYANEVLGQIPTGAIIYMSMAFIFLAPRFDRELTEKEAQNKA